MATFSIDKFFRVSQETKLPDEMWVTVRVLSDIELKARESHSLGVVARMTEALKDPATIEYQNKIVPLNEATDTSIIDTLTASWKEEWVREAGEAIRVNFYPYPENATDAEKVDVDKRQKEHEVTVFGERLKYIMAREKQFRDKAESWTREVLVANVRQRAITLYAMDAGLQEQIYWTIWRSVEKDGKPYWKSVDEVKQLPSFVIDRLMMSYREVDAQDPWALTKSQSARDTDGVGAEHSESGSESVESIE